MSAHDITGREYAKITELKLGDKVQVDDGFTCIDSWQVKEVKLDKGELYIECNEGKHFLNGQADDQIHCVGVYKDITKG